MTSKLTRERLEKIKSWRETYGAGSNVMLPAEEAEELARIALAAMDSESGCLPLDYLQGHKDGLEWAARLAEANHPDTGDWLYDDPIELAKAIRKGPDMPPAQPVEDSEPDRNPVLAYADSYRDMAKQGVQSVPIWSVITDLERNIAPLYRHAQPAPVVPDEMTIRDACKFVQDMRLFDDVSVIVMRTWNACRAAMLQAGNSPVIPDSSVIGWLRTDYQRDFQVNCTAPQFVMGKNDPSSAWGVQYMPVTKAGGQQNSPQNIPEIIPQWIPVSERMPEDRISVILWGAEIGEVTSGHYSHKTQTFYHCGDAIENEITHWMPPPCAPQEVNRE